MGESELVDRVFMRILSTETDEQFQTTLEKFLTPVLLKLSSPNEDVRKKVMELLLHINRRLKSRPTVGLPVELLLDQYNSPEHSAMVTNFSIIYLKMGFPRMAQCDQISLIPSILHALPAKPLAQQEQLLVMIFPSLRHIVFTDLSLDKQKQYSLPDDPTSRSNALDLMRDVIMMPYSAYFHPEDKPNLPAAPPLFNELRYQRQLRLGQAGAYPDAQQIESMKAGIVNLLTTEIYAVMDKIVHLIIASSDTRVTVATPADLMLQKITSDVDWEDPTLIKQLMTIWVGTEKQQGRKQLDKNQKVIGAPSRVKAKIFPLLLKSKFAAQHFPMNIQIACDGLAGPETNAKLKKLAVSFVSSMARHSRAETLKSIAPTLLAFLWRVVQTDDIARDIKLHTYLCIGTLVHYVQGLVYDNITVVELLIKSLKSEVSGDIKSAVYDSLKTIETSLSKTKPEMKILLENLIFQELKSEEKLLRKICISYAHNVFEASSVQARYVLLMACSDSAHEIATEASKLLHSKQTAKSEADKVDLYPNFTSMALYISERQQEIVSKGQTFTRGTNVIAYKLETLNEIGVYLRTCLAWSSGITSIAESTIEEWTEQTPTIYKHLNESDNPETQPAKLARLGDGVKGRQSDQTKALHFYLKLINNCIDLQAGPRNLYLLLEILAICPSLCREMANKLEWLASLLNHHDAVVQHYSSQCLVSVLLSGPSGTAGNQIQDCIDKYTKLLNSEARLEHTLGACFFLADLITMSRQLQFDSSIKDLESLTSKTVSFLFKMSEDPSATKSTVALQLLAQISISGSLCLPDGSSADDTKSELSKHSIVKNLVDRVKSGKLESKQRENIAQCLGSMGVGDRDFKWRTFAMDGLFECSSTKELELHFTVAQALALCAQALDSSARRNTWTTSKADFIKAHEISGCNEMEYLLSNILGKYINHTNHHIKQAACVWLLTAVKSGSHFPQLQSRSSLIQEAFLSMLTAPDDMTQDIAAKGLGLIYDNCSEVEKKGLIDGLVETLMTGKSTKKTTGEVSSDSKLFTEGSLGKTPEGQGMNTYRELCAIATDLNQPDLIYKFLHLANHQSMWNSRKNEQIRSR